MTACEQKACHGPDLIELFIFLYFWTCYTDGIKLSQCLTDFHLQIYIVKIDEYNPSQQAQKSYYTMFCTIFKKLYTKSNNGLEENGF